MSEPELCAAVRSSGGRVFIGFKEAGATRGVDSAGQVLVSDETMARMIQYVTAQGIRIEYRYALPAVVARMAASASLVHELRGHPNVDYLEPVFPGSREAL